MSERREPVTVNFRPEQLADLRKLAEQEERMPTDVLLISLFLSCLGRTRKFGLVSAALPRPGVTAAAHPSLARRALAQEAGGAYIPRGCDSGPLMMGAFAGGGSGAGIRFSKAGICGTGGPLKAPRPCPPTSAKLGVDPRTQVSANSAAKRRCIVVFLALFCLPS
jgi:hypothetical protein